MRRGFTAKDSIRKFLCSQNYADLDIIGFKETKCICRQNRQVIYVKFNLKIEFFS